MSLFVTAIITHAKQSAQAGIAVYASVGPFSFEAIKLPTVREHVRASMIVESGYVLEERTELDDSAEKRAEAERTQWLKTTATTFGITLGGR